MLFNSFWILFVPFIVFHKQIVASFRGLNPFILPILFSLIHILLFALLVFSVSALFFYHTFGVITVFTDALFDYGLACLMIYSLLTIIQPGPQTQTPTDEKKEQLKVKHKNKVVILSCEEILYITTERPYIAIVTETNTYLHNDTLKAIQKKFLSNNFIRIHKSTIINTGYIQSYRSRKNGDYDVQMENNDQLRVSRNYNSYFKSFSKQTG